MTMSCEADRNATLSATPASTYSSVVGEQNPMVPMQIARHAWKTAIQPRRRSRSGGR